MGSLFGEYVHLNWKNYELSGTRRIDTSTGVASNSNFSKNIFKNHLTVIKMQARNTATSKIHAIEQRYNTQNKLAFDKLKLAFSKYRSSSLDDAFIELINKKWITDSTAIMNSVEWDSTNMKLKINKNMGMGVFNNEIVPKGFGASFAKISLTGPISINSMKQKIDKIEKALIQMKLSTLSSSVSFLTSIRSALTAYETSSEVLVKIINGKTLQLIDPISSSNGKAIIIMFNDFVDAYSSFKSIEKILDAKIPEIIGDVGTRGIYKVKTEALNQVLSELQLTGSKMTKQSNTRQGLTTRISQATLKLLSQSSSTFSQSISSHKTKSGTVSYKIKDVGAGRQQKSDVEFITMTNDKYGFSLKATQLLANQWNDKFNFINLQSSSLMLFLRGLAEINEDLGNHYLNILAEHTDEKGNYSSMRDDANKALTLAIGYSALSGANQMRSGGQAQIFAVWDKSSNFPKVKLWSMETIIQQLSIAPEGLTLSPSIESIKLNNASVSVKRDSAASKRTAATRRITQLLVDTRSRTIKVTLAKNFLNKIY